MPVPTIRGGIQKRGGGGSLTKKKCCATRLDGKGERSKKKTEEGRQAGVRKQGVLIFVGNQKRGRGGGTVSAKEGCRGPSVLETQSIREFRRSRRDGSERGGGRGQSYQGGYRGEKRSQKRGEGLASDDHGTGKS